MSSFARYTIGSLALLGALFVGLWFTLFPERDAASPPLPWQQVQSAPSSIGTEEDPYARRRYDWMRLHDPETGRIPPNIREKELSFAKQLPDRLAKTSTWNRRGPTNIGGRTRALAYDMSDPSGETILAAGVSGGMWRTTDGGQTWTRTFEPGQRPNVTTVVQDTSGGKTEVWYAGTGELIGNTAGDRNARALYKGNGIFKSTDGGRTWQSLSSTTSNPAEFESPFDYIYRLRIDPSNSSQDEVYAAAYNNIFRSTDGGGSWTAVLEGSGSNQNAAASQTDVAVTSKGTVYATLSSDGDRCGLFRSTDGLSWQEITPSEWPGGQSCNDDYFRTVIDVNPSDESEVWFLGYAPGYGAPANNDRPISHVLWKYDADTGSWTNYNDYLPPRGAFGRFASQRGYDLHVQVHPSKPNLLFAGGVNLWRIDTAGDPSDQSAWIGGYTPGPGFGLYQPSGSDKQHPDQHTLAFHPSDPTVMLTGSDGGVHETSDNLAGGDGGVKYTSLNNGYFTTQFYHVCMNGNPTDPTIMGGMQDNGTWRTDSPDPTEPWTEQQGGDGAECEIVSIGEDDDQVRTYASTQGGRITQYPLNQDAYPQRATGTLFVHPFEIDPADPSVMYYPAGDSLYRHPSVTNRADDQSLWEALPDVVPNGYFITTLKASRSNAAHVLYYGAFDADGDATDESPRLYRLEGARTNTTPTDVTGASFPDGALPSDIAVDPRSSDTLLVAFSNYGVSSLFYSTDGGETWADVEGNLGSSSNGPSVRSVAILPQPGKNQTTYYVATSVGLYSTTSLSGTPTWKQESPGGIGNVVVNDVEARLSDGQVLAGTHANGVYSSNLSVPVEVADFDASVSEESRSVTLTWRIANGLSPRIKLQHLYRNSPFEEKGSLETPTARTYRYQVDSLPVGPHTFRIRQVEGPSSDRILQTKRVVVAPEGEYDLTSPAPNPFRQSTTMRLTVKEQQRVRVALYNTLGQRVATLRNQTLSANRPTDLRLTSDDLSSGVYVVRVRGETFKATRKVVLVE